jgi:hypothetical protein
MVVPHYNKEYKINNSWKRNVLVIYLVTVLLSSLIGDSIILIASLRCNAINLNKIIVAVMQHIAVCDLLLSIVFVLPTISSLIEDGWVLGDAFGMFRYTIYSLSAQSNNILI